MSCTTTSSPRATRRVTLILALAMLLASLGTSSANIVLPALADAFAAPFDQVQAVVVAYLAALTISVHGAGKLGDRVGNTPALLAGLVVFIVSSLCCAAAPTLGLLITARAFQGMGAAVLMTLSMALMRQTVDETRVGRAMGLLGTVSALGTALGPSLGGLLLPFAGWRGVFWAPVPLAVLALVLAVMALPHTAGRARNAAQPPSSAWTPDLMPALLVNALVAAVMMTTLVVGPFYLGAVLGLDAPQIGFVMAAAPVMSIFSGVPSGWLVDRQGSRRVLTIGLTLLAMGSALLTVAPGLIGLAGYLLALAVLTPGYQLFQAANNTAVMLRASAGTRGTLAGMLGLSRNVGLIAGATCMGTVFAYGVGSAEMTHASTMAVADGMRLTFLVATVLMLIAIGVVAVTRIAVGNAGDRPQEGA